jgi:hypothetical protein
MFGMDSSHMIICEDQRRSLFSVVSSSSIPFCIIDYFVIKNKDAMGQNITQSVNHISSHPFPSHLESIINKNNNNTIVPFSKWVIFSFLYLYLQQSSSTNSTGNSSAGDSSSKTDSTQSIGSNSTAQSASHIVTHQSPYQLSYHHNNHYHGNRPHYRGSGHPRNEPLPKKTTGIPRDGLIQIPRHIPGAMRDQSGASVVPRQMA